MVRERLNNVCSSEHTWPGWRSSCASAADVSEGTLRLATPGVVFTIRMNEKAFIPKLAVGKSPEKQKQIKILNHDV